MMKKILSVIVLALLPMAGFAQQSPYFGVRLSFDVTHPAGSNDAINNGSGFTLKAIYNCGLTNHVYLEPGVGVFYNAMNIRPIDFDEGLYDGSIRNFGLRVPINVGYHIGLFDDFEIEAFTGPWFNVNLYTKARLEPNFKGPAPTLTPNLFDYGWKHFDAQWGFGIGATYAGKYYLSIGGAIGMTSMATFKVGNVSQRLKRNTVSVTVGYNF